MEQTKQQTLQRYRDELCDEVCEGEELLDSLERAQLQLRRVESVERVHQKSKTPRTWLLFFQPKSHLQERFDLAPELLVLLIPSNEAQARDIVEAERALVRDFRLDRGLVIVIARDENASRALEKPVAQTGRTYIIVPLTKIQNVTDPQAWLRTLLLERMGSSDLFAPGPPVFGWDFIGRKTEITAITRHLRGGRPVGLYGLRKVGKTSLLRFVRKQFIDSSIRGKGGCVEIPIHLDVQNISFTQQSRAGFMRELIKASYESFRDLDLNPEELGLKTELGRQKTLRGLDDVEVEKRAVDMMETLIEWAEDAGGEHRVLLFIDEYERLLSDDPFPLKDGLDVFDYLRGQVQSHPRTFNFLIAGLSHALASTSRFGARQNPLFNFPVDFPIAGLSQQEMNELFRKIGRRLSLDFSHEALEIIWNETGGHPYLARLFGRLVDQDIHFSVRTEKKTVEKDIVSLKRHTEFYADAAQTLAEIARAVEELDAQARFALSYMHSFPDQTREALNLLRLEVCQELNRLGILEKEGGTHRIRIGCFERWIGDNWKTEAALAVGE